MATEIRESLSRENRKSGIDIVGDVPWGTHLCHFYRTKEDLIEILVPYFKAGLENNEFCVWITSGPLGVADAKKSLREEVSRLDDFLGKGQMEILDAGDCYTKSGKFEAHRVLDGWVEMADRARENGFDGLRVTGNASWLAKGDWEEFADYERAVNDVFAAHPLIAIGSYSLVTCKAREIIDVVANHQAALLRYEGRWTLLENSRLRRIEEEIENLAKFPSEDPYPILRAGVRGMVLYANAAAVPLLSGAGSAVGKPLPAKWHKLTVDAFHSGSRKQIDIKHQGRVFSFIVVPVEGKQYVNWYGRDVTERRLAEETLKKSEAKYADLYDNAPDMFVSVDAETARILRCNQTLASRLGYSKDQLLGRPVFDVYHPDCLPDAKKAFASFVKTGEVRDAELQLRRKDGSRIDVLLNVSAVRDKNGKIVYSRSIWRDICERKQTEQERKQLLYDLGERVKELQCLYGVADSVRKQETLEEILQQVVSLIPPAWRYPEITRSRIRFDSREYVSEPFEEAEWKQSADIIVGGRCRGRVEVVYLQRRPQRDEGPFLKEERRLLDTLTGNLSEAIEHKQAEETARNAQQQLAEQRRRERERAEKELEKLRDELVRKTRLAAIGQISASIAHDLRNPLGAARNAIYYLRNYPLKGPSKLAEYLAIIDEEIGTADRIIGKLLEMARASEPDKQPVNLGQVAEEVFRGTSGAAQMCYRTAMRPEPFVVQADPDQLRQVVGNLLSNAVHATEGRGEFLVEATHGPDCDTIVFRDTGPGIAAEIRDNVFEPLVTNKDHGTGLGLTICREIVRRHGGTIEAVDHEQAGAAFRVRLPRG